MAKEKIDSLIQALELLPHPEGGFYKETYRSPDLISTMELPDRFTGSRCYATAIYFLLVQESFSAFHRIKSDETWHFYEGSPIEIFILNQDGKLTRQVLGNEWQAGQLPQFTVPAQQWFASRVLGPYGLAGCTVYPGFEFADFEMATREALQEAFPMHSSIIEELTRM
ncbi:MAG: cupin domain-containing protein [Bacteroidota bacterium]